MSFKEDGFFLDEWNRRMKVKSEEQELSKGHAENCEYADVCGYAKIQCVDKNRYNCGDWHAWKQVDLELLFKEKKDENNNYLLDF